MKVKPCPIAAYGLALLAGVGVPASEVEPSDAFLEYLAEMIDQDGEWIDPMELENLPIGDDEGDKTPVDSAEPAEESP